MHIFTTATEYLEALSLLVPVEFFTFIGALIEEIIAPIPSPIIMTLAGSIASSQDKTVVFLLWLALIGAIGKIIGSVVLYVVSDKAEDFILGKFGRFLGITHAEVESWGRHFSKGSTETFLLFLSRAIPIVPTAPISVIAGLLKLNFKKYILASFVGYLIRNIIYLYFGYVGHESYQNVLSGLDSLESLVQIVMVVVLGSVIAWMYYKRSKVDALEVIKAKLNKEPKSEN